MWLWDPPAGYARTEQWNARPGHGFQCQGLNEAGYVDGQNATIEYRWAEGHYDRLPALAADLVQQKVTVIAATSTPAALAAKAATSTVPIVFTTGGDPIKLGLVASLRRPGGNVTGSTQLSVEVGPKRLELARELFPGATTFALLVNPANPLAATVSKDLQAVADKLGERLHVLHASTEADSSLRNGGAIASSRARDRQRRSAVRQPRRAARRTRPPPQRSSNLFSARVRRRRRSDELRRQHYGDVPSGRSLRRAHSQGREARRPAGAAGHEGRAVH